MTARRAKEEEALVIALAATSFGSLAMALVSARAADRLGHIAVLGSRG